MEYEYQDIDPGLKVWYLLSGIRCDKLSTAVAAARVHPNKHEKNFDAVVAFLTQYINKRGPTPSVSLPLSLRPDLPSGRKMALDMALSKEKGKLKK